MKPTAKRNYKNFLSSPKARITQLYISLREAVVLSSVTEVQFFDLLFLKKATAIAIHPYSRKLENHCSKVSKVQGIGT